MYVEKNLWLATNFAAKMIKETNYRNKSIRIASNYYNVAEEEVSKELIKRQKKGQKGIGKGDKYKYFVYEGEITNYYGDSYEQEKTIIIKKAKTSENGRRGFSSERCLGGKANINVGKYIEKEDWDKNVKIFNNKKDAENYYNKITGIRN